MQIKYFIAIGVSALPLAAGLPAVVVANSSGGPLEEVEQPPQNTPANRAAPVGTPAPPPPTGGAPPAGGAGTNGASFKSGVTYSPYLDNSQCKSAPQVKADVAKLGEFDVLRLYGVDCNQVANVLDALGPNSKTKLFTGIFDIKKATDESKQLISQVKGRWNSIHTVSIGNEVVNSKTAPASDVVAAVNAARPVLRGGGFKGSIVTTDTMVAHLANPGLCKASDYCAVNCHAFFDGNIQPQGAGKFVRDFQKKVEAASGKKAIITESGWPSQGNTNKAAKPSAENQKAAVESLKAEFPQDLILYSAFNNFWLKDTPLTFNAEHFWGILGNAPGK